jgi:hypothetical protein
MSITVLTKDFVRALDIATRLAFDDAPSVLLQFGVLTVVAAQRDPVVLGCGEAP